VLFYLHHKKLVYILPVLDDTNLTCQESGRICDWVVSCLHRDWRLVDLPCGCVWPPWSTNRI